MLRRSTSHAPRTPHHTCGGSATVIVMAVLILVVALLVAFLSNATREIQSADVDRRGVQASDLARTAVELVTAQLRDATSRGSSYLWATQPGLVRTYDSNGSLDTVYKLYSSDFLTAEGSTFDPASDLPGDTWRNTPDVYTDLNQRVAEKYPIFDPGALEKVIGFSIEAGSVPTDDATAMPVIWLYVLADGTLGIPSAGGGDEPVAKISGASKSNPIVGRIAYWTDDDSAKINLNTAGGDTWPDKDDNGITDAPEVPAAYYETPRFSTKWDVRKLDQRSPFDNEYQRTPGHPATTYISAVFPDLDQDELGKILPRLEMGGSLGGTQRNRRDSDPNTIELDSDRLYANIDELAFNPTREPELAIDPDDLDYASFFLTTGTTSPDITPFGTPKISLWPLSESRSNNSRTVYDEAVAFCHTFGGSNDRDEYYFTRKDPLDPQGDFTNISRNYRVYDYLRNLASTPIPGYGAGFDSKFGVHDTHQIATSIYDYIRTTNLRDRGASALEPFAPDGVVYPTVIDFEGTRTAGFGRFETVSEFGYLIHQASEAKKLKARDGTTILARNISATVLWETVCLAQGMVGYRQNHIVEIEGLDQIRVSPSDGFEFYINGTLRSSDDAGISLNLPAKAELTLNAPASAAPESHPWGGTLSPALNLLHNQDEIHDGTARARTFGEGGETGYPFVSSRPVQIATKDGAEQDLRKIRLQIKTGPEPIVFRMFSNDGNRTPLGTYRFSFPVVGQVPIPLARKGSGGSSQLQFSTRVADSYTTNGPEWFDLIHVTDIVRTVQPAPPRPASGSAGYGDLRHLAVLSLTEPEGLPPIAFQPRSDFLDVNPDPTSLDPFDLPTADTRYRCLHSFATNGGKFFPMQNRPAAFGSLIKDGRPDYAHAEEVPDSVYFSDPIDPETHLTTRRPNFSDNIDAALTKDKLDGDWDTGTGYTPDGPFINKPDDGAVLVPAVTTSYFYGSPEENLAEPGQYQPNRMVTSAAQFGSLPTGIHRGRPWETLVFSPAPAAGPSHFSVLNSPPDHLFLEFFNMPVVGPYALSTPGATAGRVNLNTQIAPFTHIRRDTALYAALAAHRVTAVPAGDADSYKTGTDLDTASNDNYRLPLDLRLTVEAIRKRFDAHKIYRTASEICDVFLVPATSSGTPMFQEFEEAKLKDFWERSSKTGLSGDNVRETPYAQLYPKLTTRSNSFTVHVRAQVISKVRSSEPDEFDPEVDRIDGEWRGSFRLQRTLDPTDDRIPDYTSVSLRTLDDSNSRPTLDALHRIHIDNVRRFNPRPTKTYQ